MQLKLYVTFLILVFTQGFVAYGQAGTYIQKDNSNYLELRADGTYHYEYRTDTFIDLVSDGTWVKKDSKTIVLNSDIEPIQPEVEWEKIPTPCSHRDRHLNVEVLADEYNETDFFVVPITKRMTVPNYRSGQRGSHTVETAFLIDSISFKIIKEPVDNPRPRPQKFFHKQALPPKYEVLETEKLKLMLNPGESANVTIFLFNEDFEIKTFKNKELTLKGKTILYRDEQDEKTYELERK